jgi:hypothetical protein
MQVNTPIMLGMDGMVDMDGMAARANLRNSGGSKPGLK